MLKNKKIAFIGAGKMAEALIRGLVSSGALSARNIYASDVSSQRLKHLKQEYGVRVESQNVKAAAKADIIILSVKPQVMGEVLKEIGLAVRSSQLIISIAAGINTKSIRKFTGRATVIRVMPNNPALIGCGITAISTGAKRSDVAIADAIFSSVGATVSIGEKHFDQVTALSGSGPAFVYLFAEALIEGACGAGLKKDVAGKLALDMILGSAKTMKVSGRAPRELREMVTSPKGTTLAGLRALEKHAFKGALKTAIKAAAQRSRELGKLYNP